MRKAVVATSLLLLLPMGTHAQEGAASPYRESVAMEVPLDEIATFEEAVRMIVAAAGQAKLGAAYGWTFWQSENTYALVSQLQNMAQLDDPEAWMRQFANTPGQATVMAAFEKMKGMHLRARNMIAQNVPEWTYTPATTVQPTWAEVLSYVPISGYEQEIDALTKEAMGVLRAAAFPYMVLGSRARVGDATIDFVILYDDPAAYETAIARLEQNAAWQALGPRWGQVLFDAESERYRLRPELSYQPGM